ncbi:MAG TPA: phosphoenolpyruvate synthase [Candidatus Paceibacterota bacterium]
MEHIVWMNEVGMDNVAQVGGKNASLGEMLRSVGPQGVKVPSGFIVTAAAYDYFFEKTGLDAFVVETLKDLDTKNLHDLARRGEKVRSAIRKAKMPKELAAEIADGYAKMENIYGKNTDVACRSSATAEDLPGASFAGEHETYLGIRGAADVCEAVQWAFASLFTDRAISYRADKGFDKMHISLSVGVQKMVRSDTGVSGVMFTVDTETGFRNAIVINSVYGLGEMIVQGHVTPDEYIVFKPALETSQKPIIHKKLGVKNKKMIYGSSLSGIKRTKVVPVEKGAEHLFALTDEEVLTLARWAMAIEKHYSDRAGKWTPMDMEWAKDGESGELYIVQARPETVQAGRDFSKLREYVSLSHGKELLRGISVGRSIAAGNTRLISDPKHIDQFKHGEILVTSMTDPDWEPIMKMASAIVTDKGGRTSHAAIVSRELGIPAIVGSAVATKVLKTGQMVTVDTSGSEGTVFEGESKFEVREHDIAKLPHTNTKIMVNIASPNIAFEQAFLPVTGVGLAREEFIIATHIGMHPMALLEFDKQSREVKEKIRTRMRGWEDPVKFYVDNLAYGIATIGAAFYPQPVVVRFSDFKTNEYRTLLGGEAYEPSEENPMIGWRGASRYYDPKFKAAFGLECDAMKKVRDEMGLTNVIPMIPFCRTIDEAKQTLAIMREHGLPTLSNAREGEEKVPVYLMCEIPANVILADKFLDLVDGYSIGSNDLTQLTLGLDRDSGIVAHVGNENNDAVRSLIATVIKTCRARGKHLGICGQGPSDLPDFAEFLVKEGIESMSLNPDAVIPTLLRVADIEQKQ